MKDLESKLRAGRARPRAEFTSALAGEVREASGRARQSRIGLMLALAGLVTVAVASFGGVSSASSNQPATVKHAASAASAQYDKYTPPQVHKTTPTAHTKGVTKTVAKPQAKPSQLPFTGLTLWVPLAAGLVLIAMGLVLRTRGRRRGSTAQ